MIHNVTTMMKQGGVAMALCVSQLVALAVFAKEALGNSARATFMLKITISSFGSMRIKI